MLLLLCVVWKAHFEKSGGPVFCPHTGQARLDSGQTKSPTPDCMGLGHRAGKGEAEGDGLTLDPFASARRPDLLSLSLRAT